MRATTGVNANQFEQGQKKIVNVFVEGNNTNSIDKYVIESMFKGQAMSVTVDCEGLGFCTNVIAASQVLFKANKRNYFIIDRDHHTDEEVENSWSTKRNNLIIWRKRHIENYFLDKTFLSKSKYLKSSTDENDVEKKILNLAQDRLYLDVVNLVIIKIREELKAKWIECFNNPLEFKTEKIALNNLLKLKEIPEFSAKSGMLLGKTNLEGLFN